LALPDLKAFRAFKVLQVEPAFKALLGLLAKLVPPDLKAFRVFKVSKVTLDQ
jgi:hypothetical protein